jgi:hypothetical protein
MGERSKAQQGEVLASPHYRGVELIDVSETRKAAILYSPVMMLWTAPQRQSRTIESGALAKGPRFAGARDTNGSGQVIGFDIAKPVFQVHGINTEGETVVGVGSLCSAHTKWA